MFSGFLTLGGFLLAMKNLVVLRLQEKIYDTDSYRVLHEEENSAGGLYDPLVHLTGLLVCSVGACLSSAPLILVAGYANSEIIAVIGLGFASGAISLVFKCWWEMHCNFGIYFKRLEKNYQKEKINRAILAAEKRDDQSKDVRS